LRRAKERRNCISMTTIAIPPTTASAMDRTAFHTGMDEDQLRAMFGALGHSAGDTITHHAVQAFRRVALADGYGRSMVVQVEVRKKRG
jgi:hypothetical protein